MGRIEVLIEELSLEPHPEGGRYAEVFRSSRNVDPDDGRGARSALTSIHFLLQPGEQSRWHRVLSDEVWHFYEGGGLELILCDADFIGTEKVLIDTNRRFSVVPAGTWQAARPVGEFAWVGCSVAPGFDFADFTMLCDHGDANRLRESFPDFIALL